MRSPFLRVLFGSLVLSSAALAVERPKLAVVVVIDQLSMGQIDQYEDLFGEGGFRRLLQEGTVARDARYTGAPTLTSHGHTSLATGSYASHHGIVGNDWWERGKGKVCVGHDDRYKLLSRETTERDGTAPTQLRAPTLADALRWSHPGARVVTLSLKDRGAILFGGARPRATVWYDNVSDRWTTSTYYAPELPAWVPKGAVSGDVAEWTRLADPRLCTLLPSKERGGGPAECARKLYDLRAGLDDDPAEHGDAGFEPPFPHKLAPPGSPKRGKMFLTSPYADETLFALAEKAIVAEELGADDIPDLLFISASSFDYLGHDFGPESHESLDALLREDASIARLLKTLDAKVGKGKYVFALSADHGVKPAPGKVERDGQSAGTIDIAAMLKDADAALDAAFGARDYLSPMLNCGFSYKDGALDGIDRTRADGIVLEIVRRTTGVADAYPRSLFMSALALRGDAEPYGRSYFDGRSPDFIVNPRPLWTWGDVASHGTPYVADTRVPVLFYRGGRAPMRVDGTIDVVSLTPTLALILGSPPPAAAQAGILTQVVDHLR